MAQTDPVLMGLRTVRDSTAHGRSVTYTRRTVTGGALLAQRNMTTGALPHDELTLTIRAVRDTQRLRRANFGKGGTDVLDGAYVLLAEDLVDVGDAEFEPVAMKDRITDGAQVFNVKGVESHANGLAWIVFVQRLRAGEV